MLADGLGFTQESDNHRDSGNLVVAKWRVSGSGDKRPGARGGKRKLSTFQKRLELSQLVVYGEGPPLVPSGHIMTDHTHLMPSNAFGD